jgi:hypothetical protein
MVQAYNPTKGTKPILPKLNYQVFSTRKNTSSRLKFDLVVDDGGHGAHIVESTSIYPLHPKLPSDKHEEGGNGFPRTIMGEGGGLSTTPNIIENNPRGGFKSTSPR